MPAAQPEDLPRAFQEAFNSGDLEALVALYEPAALLVAQPGQTVTGPAPIRQALQGFLSLNGKIDLQLKRVLAAGDTALVSSTWSLNGTGADGVPVELGATTTEVVRRQADGTWRYVIDDPYSVSA